MCCARARAFHRLQGGRREEAGGEHRARCVDLIEFTSVLLAVGLVAQLLDLKALLRKRIHQVFLGGRFTP